MIGGWAGHAVSKTTSNIGISGMLLTWLRESNRMTSDNLKLIDFCLYWNFQALWKNDPNKKQNSCLAGRQLLGRLGRIFQNLYFLQQALQWPHNIGICPSLMQKRPQYPRIPGVNSQFLCASNHKTQISRVVCAQNLTMLSLTGFVPAVFHVKAEMTSKNRNKSMAGFQADWHWGICPAQSTTIAAPQRPNRVVVICGCTSRVLAIRGRFRQFDGWQAKGGRVLHMCTKPQSFSRRCSQNCWC